MRPENFEGLEAPVAHDETSEQIDQAEVENFTRAIEAKISQIAQ